MCLGYNIKPGGSSAKDFVGGLSPAEKRTILRAAGEFTPLFTGTSATQQIAINESGLYKLIMRAQNKRPEVAKFQNWVTKDVLPAIRKTGGYLLNEDARQTAHADTRETMPLPPEFMAATGHRKTAENRQSAN